MPLILSIETSGAICSLAVHDNGKLLLSKLSKDNRRHSEILAPLTKELLSGLDVSLSNLDALAVSAGPGSYTGLRIGVSFAKGICLVNSIPLIEVDTLDLMSWSALKHMENDQFVCPMIDARRMEVYTQLRDHDFGLILPTQAMILSGDSFYEYLNENKICFVGDGALKFSNLCTNQNAVYKPELEAQAKNMGELAIEKFNSLQFVDLINFQPNYLKEFYTTKPKVQ